MALNECGRKYHNAVSVVSLRTSRKSEISTESSPTAIALLDEPINAFDTIELS